MMINNTGCPMNKDVDLTEEEIEKFCSLGCSVECSKFLEQYLKERKVKNKTKKIGKL